MSKLGVNSIIETYYNKIPKQWKVKFRKDSQGVIIVWGGFYERINYLNPMAARVFSSCDGTKKVIEIIEEIIECYPISERSKIEKDVTKFIVKMKRLGLVKFQ